MGERVVPVACPDVSGRASGRKPVQTLGMLEPARRALFQAIFARRSSPSATRGFVIKRHNADLCPAVQGRVEDTISRVGRHMTITFDVQGLADAGTDVVCRLQHDAETRYIALQIKADDEAKKGVYEKLKAQHHDTVSRYGEDLLDYYILLGWDQIHRADEVRRIANDFVKTPGVHVVEPAFAWNFLYEMSTVELEAVVRGHITQEDPILADARLMMPANPVEAALLIATVVQATDTSRGQRVTTSSLIESPVVMEAHALTHTLGIGPESDFPPGIIAPADIATLLQSPDGVLDATDLEALDLDISEDGRVSVDLHGHEPLLALAYEARARWNHEGSDLEQYLVSLIAESAPADALDGDAMFEVAWVVANSVLSDKARVGILAALLRYNFESVEWCCSQVGRHDLPNAYEWPDPELAWEGLASWLITVIEEHDLDYLSDLVDPAGDPAPNQYSGEIYELDED